MSPPDPNRAPPRRPSLLPVYITVFLDLLGFGIILPLLPFYAERFGATGLWIGAIVTAYSAAQFIGAPILGRVSDRVGRRPILLGSLTGSAVSLLVTGLAASLPVLLLGRALAGLFGGSIATAQAVIADVTAPKERAKYMGFLGASIGLGFVFGPAVGAGLSRFGFGTAAFAASGLAAGNLVLAYFRLPETRRLTAPTPRSRLTWANFTDALGHPSVGRILAALFFSVLAFVAMETTFALLGERRFGLGPEKLGLVFTYIGVVIVIVQGGLVGRLTARFGERALAVSGALIMAAALGLLPFAPSTLGALAALGALALGQGLASPAQTSLLSRESDADEQGGILGVGQSLSAGARGVGPIAAGWLFDKSFFLPYLAGSLLMLLAAGLLAGISLPAEDDEVSPLPAPEPSPPGGEP